MCFMKSSEQVSLLAANRVGLLKHVTSLDFDLTSSYISPYCL